MPQTTTAKELQVSYRDVFDRANKTMEPVFVLRNNQPDVAILGLDFYNRLLDTVRKAELADALDSIEVYKREKKNGQLITGKSLKDLIF